jgi:hypothetical protein
MESSEVQALYEKFAAPLADYAAKSARHREFADMLVRNLWMAMIGGRQLEDETWDILQDVASLSANALEPLKQLYYVAMRTSVTDADLASLREFYQMKPRKRA